MDIRHMAFADYADRYTNHQQSFTKEYDAEEEKIISLFEQDLYFKFDVMDNPKRELCYSLAYEYGKNLFEVFQYFRDMVQLIK